jgi:hypothetical protein
MREMFEELHQLLLDGQEIAALGASIHMGPQGREAGPLLTVNEEFEFVGKQMAL